MILVLRAGTNDLEYAQVMEALAPLKRVEWSLHKEPWKYLLLVRTTDRHGNQSWTMRSEGRRSSHRDGP